jgi:hypothetical protein
MKKNDASTRKNLGKARPARRKAQRPPAPATKTYPAARPESPSLGAQQVMMGWAAFETRKFLG